MSLRKQTTFNCKNFDIFSASEDKTWNIFCYLFERGPINKKAMMDRNPPAIMIKPKKEYFNALLAQPKKYLNNGSFLFLASGGSFPLCPEILQYTQWLCLSSELFTVIGAIFEPGSVVSVVWSAATDLKITFIPEKGASLIFKPIFYT